MNGPLVKICGIQRPAMARSAWEAGADFLGLVLAPSRRQVTVEQAREIVDGAPGRYIAVFADAPTVTTMERILAEVPLYGVQWHGSAPPGWPRWLRDHGLLAVTADLTVEDADAWLLDSPEPGSGQVWNWRLPETGGPYWLAGGLRPDTVRELVGRLKPAGVDVSSGVERNGEKSVDLIEQFVREAKRCNP